MRSTWLGHRPIIAVTVLLAATGAATLAHSPAAPAQAVGTEPDELRGFAASRVAEQLELEKKLDAAIDPDEITEWNRIMTVAPHHVGAPQTKRNADWMVERFLEWGYDAEIAYYEVLVPFPEVRKLTMLEPRRFEAALSEAVVEGDATSELAIREGLPPFNAYSADGDVTAEVVYVNQGVPRDYETLERLGIDVEGKIVIARYGGSWRGIKPKVAAERGAVACLIYNDPRDDGYFQGETYPHGAFKHSTGVQRGSVLDLPKRPGDPLTPMSGATKDATRLDRDEADTLMSIPVLPIAWSDAQPLLEALGGPVAPPEWRGALPITYRIGPGPTKARLRLQFDWSLRPAYNVIAKLEGTRPDQWILRGNHHDAWVIGARDPISGMGAVLAEAKAIGELAKAGFKPKRTIVYGAWDAEEPGLLGSTEWVEHHADELREKAAVYINTDGNSRGFLRAGGSHALESLVNEVAEAVVDPQTGVSVGERLRAARRSSSSALADRLQGKAAWRIAALGSGSDYSPFLQHLGIASLNIGFGGEGNGGEYHTAFDSHDFYKRFVDPGSVYGATLAQVTGRLTLRLANADILPFDFTKTAATVGRYVDEVIDLAESTRKSVERENRLIADRSYDLSADPTKQYVGPTATPEPPHFNFAPLKNALAKLERAAEAAKLVLNGALDGIGDPDELNRVIYGTERRFTSHRRPPAQAVVQAPHLRPGLLYRLRGEDLAWRSRSHRRARLGRRRSADRDRVAAHRDVRRRSGASCGRCRRPVTRLHSSACMEATLLSTTRRRFSQR